MDLGNFLLLSLSSLRKKCLIYTISWWGCDSGDPNILSLGSYIWFLILQQHIGSRHFVEWFFNNDDKYSYDFLLALFLKQLKYHIINMIFCVSLSYYESITIFLVVNFLKIRKKLLKNRKKVNINVSTFVATSVILVKMTIR